MEKIRAQKSRNLCNLCAKKVNPSNIISIVTQIIVFCPASQWNIEKKNALACQRT